MKRGERRRREKGKVHFRSILRLMITTICPYHLIEMKTLIATGMKPLALTKLITRVAHIFVPFPI